jgi:hypothetical protein
MNKLLACPALLILVVVSAHPADWPAKVVVSEGDYIGYATVADAIATLKARGLMEFPAFNGYVSFVEPDNKTTWTFTQQGSPAHPAAVRYVYTRSGGVLNVEITVLCQAAEEACEKFRSGIRENAGVMSKMMAGDPAQKCRVNNDAMKCGAEPVRKQTDQQIYVQLQDDGTCTIDNTATPCLDVGKKIRAGHPSDNPKIAVCAGANTRYDAVGRVMGALNDEYLPLAFGCPSH